MNTMDDVVNSFLCVASLSHLLCSFRLTLFLPWVVKPHSILRVKLEVLGNNVVPGPSFGLLQFTIAL